MLLFFNRALISLENQFPDLVEVWQKYTFPFVLAFVFIALVNYILYFQVYLYESILVLILLIFGLIYSNSFEAISIILISKYITNIYRYNKGLVLNSFLLSGIFFMFILVYEIYNGKGLELLFSQYLRGQNYIGSVLLVFLLASLSKINIYFRLQGSLLLVSLTILKFRTGLLSFIFYFLLRYFRSAKFYVSILLILLAIYFTLGFDYFIHKWDDGNDGRIIIWSHYVHQMYLSFPESLFPYLTTHYAGSEVYSYRPPSLGYSQSPHNLYLEILLRMGIVGGILAIVFLFVIFIISRLSNEKYAFGSLLFFGFFEPSLGFSLNLISIYFFLLLFTLISKIFTDETYCNYNKS